MAHGIQINDFICSYLIKEGGKECIVEFEWWIIYSKFSEQREGFLWSKNGSGKTVHSQAVSFQNRDKCLEEYGKL